MNSFCILVWAVLVKISGFYSAWQLTWKLENVCFIQISCHIFVYHILYHFLCDFWKQISPVGLLEKVNTLAQKHSSHSHVYVPIFTQVHLESEQKIAARSFNNLVDIINIPCHRYLWNLNVRPDRFWEVNRIILQDLAHKMKDVLQRATFSLRINSSVTSKPLSYCENCT